MAKKQASTATKKKAKTVKQPKVKRISWLSKTNAPIIDQYARQAKSFLKAVADGEIDDGELNEQKERLVELMKDIEPQLDDELHAKVTELICEITVYDLMQMMAVMQNNRPAAEFRG